MQTYFLIVPVSTIGYSDIRYAVIHITDILVGRLAQLDEVARGVRDTHDTTTSVRVASTHVWFFSDGIEEIMGVVLGSKIIPIRADRLPAKFFQHRIQVTERRAVNAGNGCVQWVGVTEDAVVSTPPLNIQALKGAEDGDTFLCRGSSSCTRHTHT